MQKRSFEMSASAPHSAVAVSSVLPAVANMTDLLGAKDSSRRDTIRTADLDRESRKGLTSVLSYFQDELGRIALVGQKSADVYWSVVKEARATEDKKNQCMIGTRVRFLGANSTFAAEWYRNRFSTSRDGQSRLYSEYIRKGQGHSYSMSAFKREPLWARQVIEMIEERYSILRQRAEIVAKIRRALTEYEKLLEAG